MTIQVNKILNKCDDDTRIPAIYHLSSRSQTLILNKKITFSSDRGYRSVPEASKQVCLAPDIYFGSRNSEFDAHWTEPVEILGAVSGTARFQFTKN